MTNTWNEKLKFARKSKNLSQQDVANALGITRSCYANYEQGLREPNIDIIKQLCVFLDMSADYFVGLNDNY